MALLTNRHSFAWKVSSVDVNGVLNDTRFAKVMLYNVIV